MQRSQGESLDGSVPPDAYRDLLSGTRDLEADQRRRRDRWIAELPLGNKEQILFEFEVLLKGMACFANPRNHPGPPRRTAIVAQDFRTSAILLRDSAQRCIDACRQLLGLYDHRFVFQRYLETVLPEDNLRAQLARTSSQQSSPQDSLVALRHALSNALEVIEGLLRAPQVPYRLFYASLNVIQREIVRNAYFNPLTALEFRPEFDRIQSREILHLINNLPPGESHRLVALTFLSLFRMLRYLRLLNEMSSDAHPGTRVAGRIYFVLSVLRSDARALSDYLTRATGRLLADNFRREAWAVQATALSTQLPRLRGHFQLLVSIKSALECVASSLRLEMRRTFQHDLPSPAELPSERELRHATQNALTNLRPALQNAVLFLGKALGTQLQDRGVFSDKLARRETSDRLRRDVWMFSQILRAFSAKAQDTHPEDAWNPANEFHYVREFLVYFRSMGYPLLRASDYPRMDAFMGALDRLREADLIDPHNLATAIDECRGFQDYLDTLFADIGRRQELEGVGFDRRRAAVSLKLYLGSNR
jgi:hypothetical protein